MIRKVNVFPAFMIFCLLSQAQPDLTGEFVEDSIVRKRVSLIVESDYTQFKKINGSMNYEFSECVIQKLQSVGYSCIEFYSINPIIKYGEFVDTILCRYILAYDQLIDEFYYIYGFRTTEIETFIELVIADRKIYGRKARVRTRDLKKETEIENFDLYSHYKAVKKKKKIEHCYPSLHSPENK